MSSGGTYPLKGKEGRRTRRPSTCMEPVTETLQRFTPTAQTQHLGYALADRDFTSYNEVTRFGGEMMNSSIVSLERAMGTDAEGQPASRNAYVTTGRGGPINVDLSQLWRRQAAARYDVNANFKVADRCQELAINH